MTQETSSNRPKKVYKIDKSLKLRAKQERFVYEYLIDYNATQAAIRAKYSKKTAYSIGQELLKKPEISQAVEDGKWFYQYQNGIDADWIRMQMVSLFNRCIQAIPVEEFDKASGEMVPTGEWKFEVNSATKLLDLMAKDIGMMQQNVNVNVNGSVTHKKEVRKQINFEDVRRRVEQHERPKLVVNNK